LLWTLHWPEQGRWLGYNVEVNVNAEERQVTGEDKSSELVAHPALQ
jgi:hypothetical protein